MAQTKAELDSVLESLRNCPKTYFTANQIAPVLEADACAIRLAAHKKPELLGFPVTVIGSRVRIPKGPFLELYGKEAKEDTNPRRAVPNQPTK